MAAVKWKEPFLITIPVISLAILLLLPCSQSQWISYKRNGRHSSLWHPNMPSARTLRHSHSSGGSGSRSSSNGNRPIEHRSISHSNYYTINGQKEQHAPQQQSGAYHQQQPGQARYSSADYGRRESSSNSKNVRITDVPGRGSSNPGSSYQQRAMPQSQQGQYREREQVHSSSFSHRHLPMSPQKSSKGNWPVQSTTSKSGRSGGHDATRRPVSQQAGHLLDSWPNSNTHHHLAPVLSQGGQQQSAKSNSGFSNLKPEQWGNNILVSNKPIEIKPKVAKMGQTQPNDKKASDRQLIIPSGYPVKDKTAVANTINTLTKLSPKKPIFVFMRKEGILAVKAGADAGDVIKKLAGTSKLPFYNGTNALPAHNMPTVFLAPEDMTPPTGYGKIPIPNLKPKGNSTSRPTYTKILMPGGTHMKGSLVTTSTTTTPAPTTPSSASPYGGLVGSASNSFPTFPGFEQLFQNNSLNGMSLEQKFQLLQLLRTQPNHPMADQAALAILASATPSTVSPSPANPIATASSPQSVPGFGQIVQGPTLALPTQPFPLPNGQWPPQQFQNGLLGAPSSPLPGLVSSTTPSPLGGVPSSVSPTPEQAAAGSEQDIHKLIGTIVESAVSNTVSSMLQHQNILQQPSLIGVGPPLHAPNLGGLSLRGPPPPQFGRGPPPQRPPPGPPPPRFPPFQQRLPFPPSPAPGRFPPHPSAMPHTHPSAGPPPPPPGLQQQLFPQIPPNPSAIPQQVPPSPTAGPAPHPPNPSFAPFPFQQQQQPQQPQQQPPQQPPQQPLQPQPQASQQRPVPLQHPFVPQFQLPQGYPSSTPPPSPPALPFLQGSSPVPPQFHPGSSPAPPQFQQQHLQQQQQFPQHPNAARPPPMRMVERPFNPNKGRNPLQNALQFFGISTPRPDLGKSPSPSPTPAIMSSTPYPRPSPTQPPFGRYPPFPSSTPLPLNRPPPPSPFPHIQQQYVPAQPQIPQQANPALSQQQQLQPQISQQQQLQLQQQASQQSQVQVGLQPGDGKGKKPTLIVQTPNGVTGKKNTYVITGGGQELPELNKIMKVLNDLHVDNENSPSAQSPSTPQPPPFSPSPTPIQFNGGRSPTPLPGRPTISPNVMIKNSNVGISPSPTAVTGVSLSASTQAAQQFISSPTPSPSPSPSSIRPHIMSSTQLPVSGVSPVMQIIKSIQQQIPGVQVSPSVQTIAQRQQQQSHLPPRPVIQSTPRPHLTPSPSPSAPILISSMRPPSPYPSSIGPVLFSSPRPAPLPTPTPSPGQVIISSTGFPRVINVSPSGSDTPASIHQAVVEAIMKQQAAEAGGSPPGQIVINGGPSGNLPSAGPTPQFIEVIPASGAIPGLGGNSNAKPFIVQLQQPQKPPPTESEPVYSPPVEDNNLPFDLNNPGIQIQRGTMESHETYTEKSRQQSVSSVSVSSSESSERPRPVYSRERYEGKTHHHSKEISEEYPEKSRRPFYNHRNSKEQYDDEDPDHLNPNRRMYSGESSKQDMLSEESRGGSSKQQMPDHEKLIEKVITEEKIVWKQGPGQGELIPAKVRTQERIIIRPNSKEAGDSEFFQRRTPLSSAEHFANAAKGSIELVEDKSSGGLISKETSPSNFAGILRSKMKFDKLMEKLYPSKQLVSPFTISNNSANFPSHIRHASGEMVPTIASSLITTPQYQQHFQMSSVGPTLPSLVGSSLPGLISPSPTVMEQGRFRIRPGDISTMEQQVTPTRAQQQNIIVGVSPSGQPIIIQGSPSSPAAESLPSPSAHPQSSSTVEQRLIFIPQGTAASTPIKSNKPQILITTVDELPDLMAQLGGTNPEIRMVPDKATLEAELAKVAAASTAAAVAAQMSSARTSTTTTTTSPPPPPQVPAKEEVPPSVQSSLFRAPPTPPGNTGIRRMDGPEKAFTWRPAANATQASPITTTPVDNSRRLVSNMGAGMLHAMSAGFGNLGNGVINKFPWLGPSALPPQHQLPQPPPTQQQLLFQMQNGLMQKLPSMSGPYQQVLIQPGRQEPPKDLAQGAPLGYYQYKWGSLLPEQPPTLPSPAPTPSAEPSTKTPDYKLMYRSQYREEELPIPPEKLQPVSPVHKLKKSGLAKSKARTTANPIDPVSAEEYEDDDEDEVEQEELIPHDSLVPKHSRGKTRYSKDEDISGEDTEEDNPRRRQDTRRTRPGRRRRPGKLTEEEDDEEFSRKVYRSRVKPSRPTKPTYDEEDDASPPPKQRAKQSQKIERGRADIESSEETEEDYDVYDVKPALNVKRKKTGVVPTSEPVTTSTGSAPTAKAPKNKAIYVNREMFLVSGEERSKEGNPKAEPVYQPNQTGKFSVLQAPSIISGQSVVKKSGSGTESDAQMKSTTMAEPKTTAPSPTTSTTTVTAITSKATTTTSKATTKPALTTKIVPTLATKLGGKKKGGDLDDYKDTQDELKALLRKIQDRLQVQDEVYDFGEDGTLYDYYDEMQHVLSTKATTTTTTTKATAKPKKTKKGGVTPKKGKKGKNKSKKNKKGKKGKKNNSKGKVKAVTQPIPTRRPITTTTPTTTTTKQTTTTTPTYVHHHQRHPVSSLEQFTSYEKKAYTTTTTTTEATTTSTTVPPEPPRQQSVEEAASVEGTSRGVAANSQSVESNVAYVFPEEKDARPKLKRRPLWIRRRIGAAGAFTSGEGLQSVRTPNGPNGKVIRLVRRRRPLGARRRQFIQQRQQQFQRQQQQSFEQQERSSTTEVPTTSSTQASIEMAPPNYSSPPLEQYFEQNSLERRVGNSGDSTEGANGTVTLRSPKRKLKLIRLKGQRAQWRLRLQGTGEEESSEGGPRPSALIAPREVSAPLPLQAPLPAPVFTSKGLHLNHQQSQSSSVANSMRAAKSADDLGKLYTTSFSAESASSSVEAKVCIRGKCQIVSRQ